MNMGTLGMKGHKTQWASIIEAAYATKVTLMRAAQKPSKPVQATRTTSTNQADTAKNRAALAAALK